MNEASSSATLKGGSRVSSKMLSPVVLAKSATRTETGALTGGGLAGPFSRNATTATMSNTPKAAEAHFQKWVVRGAGRKIAEFSAEGPSQTSNWCAIARALTKIGRA